MSQALIPIPQCDVNIRPATLADVPFIDALQKKHSKQVGFLKRIAIEGKIRAGEFLIAEELLTADCTDNPDKELNLNSSAISAKSVVQSVGYITGADRYHKHDDVGIIYQLNVEPGKQRGFVGATLLKAMFDRAAYGCKLFCCWCAQDIAANRFWEAMGFRALAFRAGSEKGLRNADCGMRNEDVDGHASSNPKSGIRNPKSRGQRMHIFWQKRIRRGDVTTPWWFPSETTGGSMAAARLALPIPPGVHWSEVMPVVLPGTEADCGTRISDCGLKTAKRLGESNPKSEIRNPQSAKPATARSGLQFGVDHSTLEEKKPPVETRACPEPGRGEKVVRAKKRNDPRLVAAARELRDRWLEQVNAGGAGEMLIEDASKYDVSKTLPAMSAVESSAVTGPDQSAIRNPKSAIRNSPPFGRLIEFQITSRLS